MMRDRYVGVRIQDMGNYVTTLPDTLINPSCRRRSQILSYVGKLKYFSCRKSDVCSPCDEFENVADDEQSNEVETVEDDESPGKQEEPLTDSGDGGQSETEIAAMKMFVWSPINLWLLISRPEEKYILVSLRHPSYDDR